MCSDRSGSVTVCTEVSGAVRYNLFSIVADDARMEQGSRVQKQPGQADVALCSVYRSLRVPVTLERCMNNLVEERSTKLHEAPRRST